jgi:hypothetical protein
MMPIEPRLDIKSEGEPVAVLTAADLQALGPRDHTADFHCVTTWSVTRLTWTGAPLREVFASVGMSEAPAPYLLARAGDRRKAAFTWQDAIADDVLVATRLNGVALDDRHGAPLRLVAPSQYGYKSVKHLIAIDFRAAEEGRSERTSAGTRRLRGTTPPTAEFGHKVPLPADDRPHRVPGRADPGPSRHGLTVLGQDCAHALASVHHLDLNRQPDITPPAQPPPQDHPANAQFTKLCPSGSRSTDSRSGPSLRGSRPNPSANSK